MKAPPRMPLESRRELLVATIALQRFELRSHAGALRAPLRSLGTRVSWGAGLLAAATAGACLLTRRSLRGPAAE